MTTDGVLRFEVVDSLPNPRWWLRFQSLTSSKAGLSAADQIQAYLETLKKNKKEFTVRIDEPLTPKGASGEGRLLVIESPIGDGAVGISGWLIAPTGSDRFLTCSIVAPADSANEVVPALRKAFTEMELTPRDAVIAAKKERMDRGAKMVAFSKEALQQTVASEPTLYRIYRPATEKGEARELGWMSVRVIEGRRGEVDATRDPKSLHGEDNEEGLLVILDAKSILNNDARHTMDTQVRYWMAWDRLSEVWSVRSTERQGDASRTSGQTGVRTPTRPGDPRPMLRVINSISERQTRDPLEWQVPPNYISQAELVVLGKLLPKDDPAPPTFSSYAFDPKSTGLPQRTDTWKRNGDGTWTLETRLGTSASPLVQTFDENGERLKRVDVDPDGTIVTERIESSQLRALWKRKGLPIE